MSRSFERTEDHNRYQKAYFEGTLKKTMVPRDSLYLRRHVQELLRFGEIAPGDRVLELGCGMGRYTLLLAEMGIAVEGLDLSPVLLERLRAYAGGRRSIPLHCGDISDPPPALTGRFDVAAGFFVLHHLEDLPRVFGAVARLLKPGGRVVFLEPNPYNPLYYVQIAITPRMTWRGDRGILKMRRGVIFGALQEAGFRHSELERFGFFPPFLADCEMGARLEPSLERLSALRGLLPFQLFRAERTD